MFTGIDGSGKSTSAEALFDLLRQKGHRVYFFKYPTTETWKEVERYYRALIDHLSKKPLPNVTYPYNTVWAIHTTFDTEFTLTEFEKEEMYKDFDFIINDRYYETNMAVGLLHLRQLQRLYPHQWSNRSLMLEEKKFRENFSFKHKKIDLVIHLKPDANYEVYKSRMEAIDNVTKFDPLIPIDTLYYKIPKVYDEVLQYLQNHKMVKKTLTFGFDNIKDNVDVLLKKVYKNIS